MCPKKFELFKFMCWVDQFLYNSLKLKICVFPTRSQRFYSLTGIWLVRDMISLPVRDIDIVKNLWLDRIWRVFHKLSKTSCSYKFWLGKDCKWSNSKWISSRKVISSKVIEIKASCTTRAKGNNFFASNCKLQITVII